MPEHTPAPTPSRAVYGFAMYLSFKTFFFLYTTWAIIPEEWFEYIGITCLPQRYWAVSIPVLFLNILTVFAFIIYPSLGLIMSPSVDDLRTIEDRVGATHKNVDEKLPESVNDDSACSCMDSSKCLKSSYNRECGDFVHKSIPVLRDLNIWDVSDRLYLNFK